MEIIALIFILIFSVIVHEVAHGLAADYQGDPTPRRAGRLSFNPLVHLDPVGSFLVPAGLLLMTGGKMAFAWAKPVPINPHNFKNKKYGEAIVGFSGPASNFALAIIFGLLLRFLIPYNIAEGLYIMFAFIVYINLLLGIFNLIPIPPLDGSHILFTFFPKFKRKVNFFMQQYGPFLLFFLILIIVNFIFPILLDLINFVFELIVSVPLWQFLG